MVLPPGEECGKVGDDGAILHTGYLRRRQMSEFGLRTPASAKADAVRWLAGIRDIEASNVIQTEKYRATQRLARECHGCRGHSPLFDLVEDLLDVAPDPLHAFLNAMALTLES